MTASIHDLAHLLDEAPDVVIRFDRAHRHVYVSRAIERATGLPVEAFIGKTAEEVGMGPEGAELWRSALDHVFATGEERTIELETTTPDGVRYFHARLVPEHDTDGRVAFVIGVSRDLTSWRRTDEAQRRLAALVEVATDAIIGTDGRDLITSFNGGASLLFGYSPDEVIGKPIWTIIPPAEVPLAERNGVRVKRGERVEAVEGRIERKDGSLVDVSIAVSPILRADGTFEGAAGIIRDVSARKRTEEALRRRTIELAERLKEMQCLATVSRMLLNVRDDFGEAFPAIVETIAEAMLDPALACAEIVLDGQSWRTPAWPPHIELRAPIVVDSAERGSVAFGYREHSSFVPPFLPEERELLGMVADRVAETLRRQAAEQEVRRSAAYFQSVIENSRDMLAVLDASATFRYVSPSTLRVLGYSQEELVGSACFDRIHPDDRADVAAMFARSLEDPTFVGTIEYRYRHADGSWRSLESTGTNLLADPGVQGFVANTRDVTDRRLLEEQFRHAQKLDAVGRLAGGIAHDFNNLLTVMMGAAETLLLDNRIAGERRVDVEQIRDAAVRAASLTKQLLAFSRRQVLHPRLVDVNEIVRGIEDMLRRLIGADIAIQTSLAPRLGALRVDPGQVEQVLVNLVVNARDAMPDGGTIAISTVAIPAAAAPPELRDRATEFAVLSISDTGHGMASDVRARAFEPFFTTRAQGTGLGLATVYGIVAQSGGHVALESELGRGTTVRVYLPIVGDVVRAVGTTKARDDGPHTGGVVLVVEDEDVLRAIVCRALTRAGYRVLDASSAESAELLAESAPQLDLLLTDVGLPGRSGVELAQSLGKRRPALKRLFMTGYSDAAIHGRLAGAEILQKPFTPDTLVRLVRRVLEPA